MLETPSLHVYRWLRRRNGKSILPRVASVVWSALQTLLAHRYGMVWYAIVRVQPKLDYSAGTGIGTIIMVWLYLNQITIFKNLVRFNHNHIDKLKNTAQLKRNWIFAKKSSLCSSSYI